MNLASLFDLGGSDLIIILVIVLLLFGAKKRADFPRGFREALHEFRKSLNEAAESQDEPDRTPKSAIPFNAFASVLVFVALTVLLLALASR